MREHQTELAVGGKFLRLFRRTSKGERVGIPNGIPTLSR